MYIHTFYASYYPRTFIYFSHLFEASWWYKTIKKYVLYKYNKKKTYFFSRWVLPSWVSIKVFSFICFHFFFISYYCCASMILQHTSIWFNYFLFFPPALPTRTSPPVRISNLYVNSIIFDFVYFFFSYLAFFCHSFQRHTSKLFIQLFVTGCLVFFCLLF